MHYLIATDWFLLYWQGIWGEIPTSTPPIGSTGMLNAIRCEQYTHTLFKNRESPHSPTQSLTAETFLLKWSPVLWLLSKTSITDPFSSSSQLRLSSPSLRGRDFASITLNISQNHLLLFFSQLTHTESWLSHGSLLSFSFFFLTVFTF